MSAKRYGRTEYQENEQTRSMEGVAFAEAMTVFGDPFEVTIADPGHSEDELRFLSLGVSASGRLLVVAYTERGGRTRIINARQATAQERKQYESSDTSYR